MRARHRRIAQEPGPAFLDPNDNNQIVVIDTFRGFIAPGENANFGKFDHRILHVVELETTGDPNADKVRIVVAETERPSFASSPWLR